MFRASHQVCSVVEWLSHWVSIIAKSPPRVLIRSNKESSHRRISESCRSSTYCCRKWIKARDRGTTLARRFPATTFRGCRTTSSCRFRNSNSCRRFRRISPTNLVMIWLKTRGLAVSSTRADLNRPSSSRSLLRSNRIQIQLPVRRLWNCLKAKIYN